MSQHIEDRLRSALRAEAEGLRLSPDPWQENQRRVSAAASGRSRRVLTVAAVALAVATLAGGVALLGGGGAGDAPASGTGDPFTTEYLLGAPVEAERLTVDGVLTTHTIALSDMTGAGPNLCEQYETISADRGTGDNSSGSSSGSGGCTPRGPNADDAGVAFDWLMGTEGGGDIRGVTAGVDSRVSKVQIWMDNGDMMLATLHPTGWDDTRMFALTTEPPDAPTAQRLVAYGRDGNVLQAVELSSRFGKPWLTERSACDGDRVAESVPDGEIFPNAYVALGTNDARVSVRVTPDDASEACLERLRPSALAGWYPAGSLVVAVLGAEVAQVQLVIVGQDGDERVLDDVVPSQVPGRSPWRVVSLRAESVQRIDGAELVVRDRHGLELDRAFVNQPPSP